MIRVTVAIWSEVQIGPIDARRYKGGAVASMMILPLGDHQAGHVINDCSLKHIKPSFSASR